MIWWLLPALAGPAQDRALIGQLDREVIALRQKIEVLEERLRTCSTDTVPSPLYAELRGVLGGQPATLERAGKAVRVIVPLDTFFSPEGRELREEAAPLADLLATALKLHPEVRVQVQVHLDSGLIPPSLKKSFPTAWELSAWRAALLVRVLVERFEVPGWMLTAAARGDQEPVSTDGTPEGRQLDRRVVFFIEPGASAP